MKVSRGARNAAAIFVLLTLAASACSEDPSGRGASRKAGAPTPPDASTSRGTGTSPDGDTTADPIPWSEAAKLGKAQSGEYQKAFVLSRDGSETAALKEWVTFDLGTPFVDRRVGAEGFTAAEASREAPSLRVIYKKTRIVMWNPGARGLCGTPWVEMPPKKIEQLTGLTVGSDFYIEPLAILRRAKSPKHVRSDGGETVYEISVPPLTGLPYTSFIAENPELVRRVRKEEQQTAQVVLPRGGGPVQIELDFTHIVEALQGAPSEGQTATITWGVTAPSEVRSPKLPTDVAGPGCLDD